MAANYVTFWQVPFGKKAFMPGQLIHTNEILVLLGDNWFAERSAKQAGDIVERRIAGACSQADVSCPALHLFSSVIRHSVFVFFYFVQRYM